MLIPEMGTIAILASELATYSATVHTCLLACLLTYMRYYLLPVYSPTEC